MKKELSRQRLHQIKMKEMGRCGICGKDLHPILKSCPPCLERIRLRVRKSKGYAPQKSGGPGRPSRCVDDTGTQATTTIDLMMSKADYSLSNTALASLLNVSPNTVGKYRKVYGTPDQNRKEIDRMMSQADYSMTNKELAYLHNVSTVTAGKYRRIYGIKK